MKIYGKIVLFFGLMWLLSFTVILISKIKSLDENMWVVCILSSYTFIITGVVYLIIKLTKKISRSK